MEIRNRYLNGVFNICDLPIRYLFSRLGRYVPLTFFGRWYHRGSVGTPAKFREADRIMRQSGVKVSGMTVLELGPGGSRACAYGFLRAGAARVLLVDKFPRKCREVPDPELDRRIVFHACDVSDISQDERADLIFSHSVLEHVRDVDAAIAAMSRIVRPGGYLYHRVDMRDHYNFSAPFLFYKYSDALWERFLTREGVSYTNRWRYRDFLDAFRHHGMEVVREVREELPVPDLVPDARFRGRDDLGISRVTWLFRRSNNTT